jgi:hypothetical protein
VRKNASLAPVSDPKIRSFAKTGSGHRPVWKDGGKTNTDGVSAGGAQDVHRTGELGVDPGTGWRTGPDPLVDPAAGTDMLVKAGSIVHFSILTVRKTHIFCASLC